MAVYAGHTFIHFLPESFGLLDQSCSERSLKNKLIAKYHSCIGLYT